MTEQSDFDKWWKDYREAVGIPPVDNQMYKAIQTAWKAGTKNATIATCKVWIEAMEKVLLEEWGRADDSARADRETEKG